MRVLLDANVFVAALLRSKSSRVGSCRTILEAFRDGAFTLITAKVLVAELSQVLSRPKFFDLIAPKDVGSLLELIHRDGVFVVPQPSSLAIRDPKDRPVVNCLYAADVLVTGDHDLQILKRVDKTAIMSPAAFLTWLTTSR